MTDIVERLRTGKSGYTTWAVTPIHIEAADEIERLREAALHRISLGSQDSGTTKESLGHEARCALENKQ